MKTARSCRVFLSFVTAFALLLPIAPHLGGSPHAGLAMAQGSRLPGMPVPSTDRGSARDRGPVKFPFTKWITTFPLMEGFTGGDVTGDFVGEVFERQVTMNPNLNGIARLEVVYEVHAGDRSFTALIRGGTNTVTGAAILDGVVLAGWRTGADVHVEFDTLPGTTGCVGAPQGVTCFEGTIRVGRAPKD
jgi:hypothetical protein